MRARRHLLAFLGAVSAVGLCAAGLAGCSGLHVGADGDSEQVSPVAPIAARPTPGGHLLYAIEADPNGLDPTRNAWDNSGLQLANALYDPLVAIDAQGRPQPYLAESLTASADYRLWTIKLRRDVRFSDGDLLDAAAVVTFMNALRESAITGPAAKMVAAARAVDPLTVELTTSQPWASLPVLLSGQGGYVISPKQLADPEGTSKPIGSGPFMLRRWTQDKRFELVRNPRYWRKGLPLLDAVDFVVEPEGERRIDEVAEGEVDATSVSAPWELQHLDEVRARRQDALQVEDDTGDAEKTSIMFNTTKAPVDDVRVRRAIAYATDMPALAASAGWPEGTLARGPISADSPFFSPAGYPEHNLEKAKALVREYLSDTRVRNRPREVSFTVLASDHFAGLAHQLAAQWAQAGVKASVSLVDVKQLVRFAVLGAFDAMLFRYFAAPDPDLFWHFFVADTITTSGISLNFTRLRNDTITAGMMEARATADVEVRRQAYARVQAAFADQLPFLWLQRWEWKLAVNPRLHDAHNVTLPGGSAAMPLVAGTHRLAEAWISR
jgi:peptide/nickel transport system substrate-binding protein